MRLPSEPSARRPVARHRPRRSVVVLAAALVLAGCSGSEDERSSGRSGGDRTPTTSASGRTTTSTGGSNGSGGGDTGKDVTYPGASWAKGDPAELGFDTGKLDGVVNAAGRNRSTCMIVIRHGKVAGEWYWNGGQPDAPIPVWSVTKSISSTLVGIAQDDGDLKIDEKASDYIPEWKGTPSEPVTIRNILSNDSGRQWDFETDFVKLTASPDRTKFAVDLRQQKPPGTRWAYSNAAIQTLQEILVRATGEEPAAFAEQKLFEPLGMDHTKMTTDRSGNTQMYMGLETTCRDAARFGYLFLHQGSWKGEQIVSRRYVREATRPSQDIFNSYGYLWWLNVKSPLESPQVVIDQRPTGEANKQNMFGVSTRAFAAIGMFGQVIQVDPATDTVVVRLGESGGSLVGDFNEKGTAMVISKALVRPKA